MVKKVYTEFVLLKAQQGDTEALQELLNLINDKLSLFAGKLLSDESLAQDALQNALIAIAAGLKTLRSPRAFHTWIYRITSYKCHDQLRQLPINTDSDGLDALPSTDDTEPSDTELDVRAAIQQLAHSDQALVYLFYYEGFTVAEIADILKQSQGTLKSRLFHIRKKMQHLFGEQS
ncbi:RNA polymerase sigma factor [Marinicella sp. W31]|uniref:RNA polymerase sigma factor n=1 Tax=Marinicella sp. W31 TaxID=3023713 RepID=UPI003757C0E1